MNGKASTKMIRPVKKIALSLFDSPELFKELRLFFFLKLKNNEATNIIIAIGTTKVANQNKKNISVITEL